MTRNKSQKTWRNNWFILYFLFYLFVWLSIRHSNPIYFCSHISKRAFLTAETRSGVHTPDTRKTWIKLTLKHKKEHQLHLWDSILTSCSTHLKCIIHTSSTSSQLTPSPVNPSGHGAHWNPPDSVGMHMFCLKQVPGGHRVRGWGCMTYCRGFGTAPLLASTLVGLPPSPEKNG